MVTANVQLSRGKSDELPCGQREVLPGKVKCISRRETRETLTDLPLAARRGERE